MTVKEIAKKLERSERYIYKVMSSVGGENLSSMIVELPDPKENENLVKSVRERLEFTPEGFEKFFNAYSGRTLQPIHKELVTRALESTRVLLNIPPRHAKSTIFSVWFPIWLVAMNRDIQIIICSKTADLAKKFTNEIAYNLSYNTALVKDFGRFRPELADHPWRPNTGELMVEGRRREVKSGDLTIQVRGAMQQILGMEADWVIVDDAVSRANVATEGEREKLSTWLHGDVLTRLEPGSSATVIGQRLHVWDLYGELSQETIKSADGTESPRWTHLNYPAVKQWPDPEQGLEAKVLWPEKWTFDALMEVYADTGQDIFECTPAETPILMADFTEKPICKVQEGDMVMGFKVLDKGIRAVPSRVKHVMTKPGIVKDITFESGRNIRATEEHLWWSRPGKKRGYHKAAIGSRLPLMFPPIGYSLEEQQEWWYLAGLVDGEGHIGDGSLRIAQSSTANPDVFERMILCLDRLGLSYRLEEDKREGKGYWCVSVHDTKNVLRALLQATGGQLGKAQRAYRRLSERSTWAQSREKIVSIEGASAETVYALETETENYYAWGFPCHNSMYQQNPLPEGDRLAARAWIYGDDTHPGCLDITRNAGDASGSYGNAVRVFSIDPSPTRYAGLIVADLNYNRHVFECEILEIRREKMQVRDMLAHIERVVDWYSPQYFVFEQNAAQRWFLQDPIMDRLRSRLRVIPHTTARNKGDPLLGVESLSTDFEFGRIRLPYGDAEAKAMSKFFIDEALTYPQGKTDDLLMALWFLKFNFTRLVPFSRGYRDSPGYRGYNVPERLKSGWWWNKSA